MKLLLASKSAARRRMLEAAGVPFEVVESAFDEEEAKIGFESASELAMTLAKGKALSAPGDLVLGSDQVLECEDGLILNKASSRKELFNQLRSLSGKSHRLHSAAAIAEGGLITWTNLESATLYMRDLSEVYLADYLSSQYDEVRWSVGGYHLEGMGAQLFERIEGSHFAVLGLPLLPLLEFLRTRGVLQR